MDAVFVQVFKSNVTKYSEKIILQVSLAIGTTRPIPPTVRSRWCGVPYVRFIQTGFLWSLKLSRYKPTLPTSPFHPPPLHTPLDITTG